MKKQTLDAKTLWAIPRVGAPLPSPDGRWVLLPVTTCEMEKNRTVTRLWLLPASGKGAPRALTAADRSSGAPAWSPDGKMIAFVRKTEGEGSKPQIHLLSLDGGEAEALTDLAEGATAPRFFADGKSLAFLSIVRSVARSGEAPESKVHVTEDRLYRYWDHWLEENAFEHIHRIDLKTRAITDLTPRLRAPLSLEDSGDTYALSPDGKEIAYVACTKRPPHHRLDWGLFVVGAGGGRARQIPIDGAPSPGAPHYSPDGRKILVGSPEDAHSWSGSPRLYLVDRATGKSRRLAPGWKLAPTAWQFDPRRGHVYALADVEGASALFRVGARAKEIARGGRFEALAVTADRLWATISTLRAPAELFSFTKDGKSRQRVTSFTAKSLRGVTLGSTESRVFKGSGDEPVQMWIVHPPGKRKGKRLPLVHLIHGGPYGSFADEWHARWNAQLFAARGYRVAMVNFHGSTGWGEEFTNSITGSWAEKPFEDVMRATDDLIARGLADPKRLAATGGSYGGYLVSWIATRTRRFACLVNHAGVCDLQTQFAMDIPHDFARQAGGDPSGDLSALEGLDRWNPIRHAHGFHSPMLVIHGELDYRVPCDQARLIYNLHRHRRRPARLVVYDDENHWILKPKNSIHWYGEVLGWLRRWF